MKRMSLVLIEKSCCFIDLIGPGWSTMEESDLCHVLGYGLFQVDIPYLFHLGNLFLYSFVLKRHKRKI
jgi:hypothetical protein